MNHAKQKTRENMTSNIFTYDDMKDNITISLYNDITILPCIQKANMTRENAKSEKRYSMRLLK
jgi:hypothetical protein